MSRREARPGPAADHTEPAQQPTEPTIRVRDISKSYGPVHALRNVSLDIRAGEVIGLVGDNGAGKSTLVKVLSGAEAPDSGSILVKGNTARLDSPAVARRLGIETVYQDLALAPHLSVTGNLFLGRELRRRGFLGKLGFVSDRKMTERATAWLSDLRIEIPHIEASVHTLSGGQRQAVAIARAAEWSRLVTILDEPTAALGVEESAKVLEIIRETAGRGLAVIFVSHTLPFVMEATDRIVVLRRGEIVARARTADCSLDEVVGWITGARLGRDHMLHTDIAAPQPG